jgi:hypothetical protein
MTELDNIFSIFLMLVLKSVSKFVNLIDSVINLPFVSSLYLTNSSTFWINDLSEEIKLERLFILCSKLLTFDS